MTDQAVSLRAPAPGRMPFWIHGGAVVATFGLLAAGLMPALFTGDVGRYAQIASGPTFWTGQPVEFPPLTAAFIWLTARWGAVSLITVPLANLLLDMATAVVVLRGWGREAVNRYLLLAAAMLPLTLFRVDHLPVLLTVLGLAAARRGKNVGAGVLLASGVLAKLWPAAVIVAFPGRHRTLLTVATLAVVGAGTIWVTAFGGDALAQVLTFRGASGWQIESMGGSLLLLGGHQPIFEGGAWRVGTLPRGATVALMVLGTALLVRTRRMACLEQRQLALVVGMLLVSPLLSPQFLLWLIPLVAIQPDPSVRRQLTALLGLAIAYSMLLATYYGYLIDGETLAAITVLLRNLCLAAMLWVSLHAGAPSVRSGATGP